MPLPPKRACRRVAAILPSRLSACCVSDSARAVTDARGRPCPRTGVRSATACSCATLASDPRVQAAREKEESQRRTEEARRREEDRINREFAEAEAEEVQRILAERGAALNIKDGETLDKQALLQKESEIKAKEQNEFESRMAKLARSMDHLERARRDAAAPYLKESMAARAGELRVHYEREQAAALVRHRAKWEADIVAKHATAKLLADRCAATAAATAALPPGC